MEWFKCKWHHIFVAHLIVMGLVKKTSMAKYWSTNSFTRTPFFGKVLPRNTFQNILMNLHIADNNTDYPSDNTNHDPLHKVRVFMQICEKTFKVVYRPGCDFHMMRSIVLLNGDCGSTFIMPKTDQVPPETVSDMWGKKWLHMFIWYLQWKGPDKMYTKCTGSGSKLYKNNKPAVRLMDSGHLWTKGIALYGQFLYKSRTLWWTFLHSTYACGTVHREALPHCKTKENRSSFQMKLSPVGYTMVWQKGNHSFDHNTSCSPCRNKKTDAQGIEF